MNNAITINVAAPLDQAMRIAGEFQQTGCLNEAETIYRDILAVAPEQGEALYQLGKIASQTDRHGMAADWFDQAARAHPDNPLYWTELAGACWQSGRFFDAESAYAKALAIDPHHIMALVNLGELLRQFGHLNAAIVYTQRALEFQPDNALIHTNLGNIYIQHYDYQAAQEHFGCADRLGGHRPNYVATKLFLSKLHLCDWEYLSDIRDRLFQAILSGAPGIGCFEMFNLLSSPQEQQQHARNCSFHSPRPESGFPGKPPQIRTPGEKLRIGFLSADFHHNPVSQLIVETVECHDSARAEWLAYGYGADDGSNVRQRLVAAFDRFEDVRLLSSQDVARKIHEDNVDILVDLTGYTGTARQDILSYRPAPVQVHFLGYTGTLASADIDYLIADKYVIPERLTPFYDEKIVWLPHTYLPGDSQRPIAPTPTRAEAGLPETGFVFCSFNQIYKFTPELFDLWMRLLAQVPGSVLWLWASNPWAPDNLRREAQARGIDSQRLIFAPTKSQAEHLGRLRLADIFLDTYPVNAHTTASDALWSGVPVLTRSGETFVSRVAGSLLHTAGLPELITETAEDYERTALELALKPERLAHLKARLSTAKDTSPLFDSARFARHLNDAFELIWRRYEQGLPPGHIEVPPAADDRQSAP